MLSFQLRLIGKKHTMNDSIFPQEGTLKCYTY